ncbi:hypothetical protein RI367_001738 [Sorochytrium milnesiophthora]
MLSFPSSLRQVAATTYRSGALQCARMLPPLLQHTRGAKTGINSVRPGHVVNYKNKPHLVVKTHHSVMGRGSAHVKLDLKDVVSGTKITERFKSGDSVETVHVRTRTYNYMYHDDSDIHVTDPETFEQLAVPVDALQGGEKALPMLEDSTPLTVSLYNDAPIAARLPTVFVMRIVETSVPMKGGVNATAKGIGYKPATLQNGLRVEVPDFCKEGDEIELAFEEGSARYMRRIM